MQFAVSAAAGFAMSYLVRWLFPVKMSGQKKSSSELSLPTIQETTRVPVLFGTRRLSGNYIWIGEFKKHEHKESAGGKGGGSSSYSTYTYTASFAIALIQTNGHRDAALRRIWQNDTELDMAEITGNENIRFYGGSKNQEPDPLIAASVQNAPAYRTLVYIVFEDFNLGSSPSLPVLSFEIEDVQGIDISTGEPPVRLNRFCVDEPETADIPWTAVDSPEPYYYDPPLFARFEFTDGILTDSVYSSAGVNIEHFVRYTSYPYTTVPDLSWFAYERTYHSPVELIIITNNVPLTWAERSELGFAALDEPDELFVKTETVILFGTCGYNAETGETIGSAVKAVMYSMSHIKAEAEEHNFAYHRGEFLCVTKTPGIFDADGSLLSIAEYCRMSVHWDVGADDTHGIIGGFYRYGSVEYSFYQAHFYSDGNYDFERNYDRSTAHSFITSAVLNIQQAYSPHETPVFPAADERDFANHNYPVSHQSIVQTDIRVASLGWQISGGRAYYAEAAVDIDIYRVDGVIWGLYDFSLNDNCSYKRLPLLNHYRYGGTSDFTELTVIDQSAGNLLKTSGVINTSDEFQDPISICHNVLFAEKCLAVGRIAESGNTDKIQMHSGNFDAVTYLAMMRTRAEDFIVDPFYNDEVTGLDAVDEMTRYYPFSFRTVYNDTGTVLQYRPAAMFPYGALDYDDTPMSTSSPAVYSLMDTALKELDVRIDRVSVTDTKNRVRINYTNRSKKYDRTVESADNEADEMLTGGRRDVHLDLLACCTPEYASTLADFYLQKNLERAADITITSGVRYLNDFLIGRVITLVNDISNVSYDAMIVETELDDKYSLIIKLRQISAYAGGGNTPAVQTPLITSAAASALKIKNAYILELPKLVTGGKCGYVLAVEKQADDSAWAGCNIHQSVDGGNSYSLIGDTSTSVISGIVSAVNDKSITVSLNSDATLSGYPDAEAFLADGFGNLAYMPDADIYIRIGSAVQTAARKWQVTMLVNNVFGYPQIDDFKNVPFGRIIFLSDDLYFLEKSSTLQGRTYHYKFASFNSAGQAQALTQCTAYSDVYDALGDMPIHVSNLQVNGFVSGDVISAGDLHVSWVSQNRLRKNAYTDDADFLYFAVDIKSADTLIRSCQCIAAEYTYTLEDWTLDGSPSEVEISVTKVCSVGVSKTEKLTIGVV
jgi:hypothetical protein